MLKHELEQKFMLTFSFASNCKSRKGNQLWIASGIYIEGDGWCDHAYWTCIRAIVNPATNEVYSYSIEEDDWPTGPMYNP